MRHTIWAACLGLLAACASSGAVQQGSLPYELGGELYPFGDAVEIHSVASDSGDYSVGATLTVRGTYRLESRAGACLYLGVTNNTGRPHEVPKPEVDRSRADVKAGRGEFVLVAPIRSEGYPHVTFYDHETGQPFGGVYFGRDRWLQREVPTHYARSASPQTGTGQDS